WRRFKPRPEVHWEERDMPRYPAMRSALAWDLANLAAEGASRIGLPSVRVRYEDLVDDPRRALRRIVDALDLGPADLAFVSGRSATVHPAHTVAGNPMRFEQGTLHLRLDDEWRTRMPLASLRLVTALTRPLLSRYGYDVSPVTPD